MTRPDSPAERVSEQMSNALYNLSQAKVFTDSHREQCADLVKAWDDARALRSRLPSEAEVARAISGAPFPSQASLRKARAVLALFTPAREDER